MLSFGLVSMGYAGSLLYCLVCVLLATWSATGEHLSCSPMRCFEESTEWDIYVGDDEGERYNSTYDVGWDWDWEWDDQDYWEDNMGGDYWEEWESWSGRTDWSGWYDRGSGSTPDYTRNSKCKGKHSRAWYVECRLSERRSEGHHQLAPVAFVGDEHCEQAADDIVSCMHDKVETCAIDPNSFLAIQHVTTYSEYSREVLVRWMDCLMDEASVTCILDVLNNNKCKDQTGVSINFDDISGSVCSMLNRDASCLVDEIRGTCGDSDADVVAGLLERTYGPTTSIIQCQLTLTDSGKLRVGRLLCYLGIAAGGALVIGLVCLYKCHRQKRQRQQRQRQHVVQDQQQPAINITNVHQAPPPAVTYPGHQAPPPAVMYPGHQAPPPAVMYPGQATPVPPPDYPQAPPPYAQQTPTPPANTTYSQKN